MQVEVLALILPLAAIMLPVVLVPIVMGMKQTERKLQREHAERMRAMELGLPPGATKSDAWAAALTATAIGAVTPMGLFVFALAASGPDFEVPWVVAGIVGTTCAVL